MTTSAVSRRIVLTVAASVGLALWLIVRPGPDRVVVLGDDLLELAAAAGAAVAALRTSRRARARDRRAWLYLAASTGCWALGQALWTFEEQVRHVPLPFPSPADAGYLASTPLAAAALLTLAAGQSSMKQARALLDGLIVAGSLLMVSWATVLQPMFAHADGNAPALVLSLAYPAGDVVIATMALALLTRLVADARGPAVLLALGMLAIALSDSGFAYVVQQGRYGSHTDLLDVGWLAGFLLVGAAALAAREHAPVVRVASRPTVARLVLPYLAVVPAVAVMVVRSVRGDLDGFLAGAAIVGGALVLLRQLLTMLDNVELIHELSAREQELRDAAFRDPLTGLANRVLFWSRVDHALARRPGPRRTVALLICDLDGFKAVNDRFGHQAGDAVLVEVAERLSGCIRQEDTAARIGGDEFAVLLDSVESSHEASTVAERIVTAMRSPFVHEEAHLPVGVSIGVCPAEEGSVSGEEMFRLADGAMYRAKARGRGCVESLALHRLAG